jgi:hypothetical protein
MTGDRQTWLLHTTATLVEKLHTIIYFQPDFNYMKKYLGRQIMRNAEKYGQLTGEQFGIQNGLTLILQLINNHFTLDITMQRNIVLTLCSNDVKSCFDREVHSVASNTTQQQNVPESACICIFTTLQNMRHTIWTVYRDSEEGYGGTLWVVLYHGIGQGNRNGAGPTIWEILSSQHPTGRGLRILLSDKHHKLRDSISRIHLCGRHGQHSNIAYRQHTREPYPTPRRTNVNAVRMQGSLESWDGSLVASGEALEPSKSFWYLLSFEWQHGCWRYTPVKESPAKLTLKDSEGVPVELTRLEAHESRKTLGVKTAPDGSSDAEFDHLLALTESWRDKVRAIHLRKLDVWQALHSTIWMSLKYPLPETTLSESQFNKITTPALMAGITNSHICRNFPRVLIHAPPTSIRAGIPDIFTTQNLEHIDIMITHGRSQSLTCQLLRATFEAFVLECGIGRTLCNPTRKPMLTVMADFWVKYTIIFLQAM